jgi:hypothetical protein
MRRRIFTRAERDQTEKWSSSTTHGAFFKDIVQEKCTVNEAGDRWEREAGATADRVMQAAAEQDGHASAEHVRDGNSAPNSPPGGHAPGAGGSGFPLPADALSSMNAAFGTDLFAVRIHADDRAAAMSSRIQARAFTHGSDVFFNKGQYDPYSSGSV